MRLAAANTTVERPKNPPRSPTHQNARFSGIFINKFSIKIGFLGANYVTLFFSVVLVRRLTARARQNRLLTESLASKHIFISRASTMRQHLNLLQMCEDEVEYSEAWSEQDLAEEASRSSTETADADAMTADDQSAAASIVEFEEASTGESSSDEHAAEAPVEASIEYMNDEDMDEDDEDDDDDAAAIAAAAATAADEEHATHDIHSQPISPSADASLPPASTSTAPPPPPPPPPPSSSSSSALHGELDVPELRDPSTHLESAPPLDETATLSLNSESSPGASNQGVPEFNLDSALVSSPDDATRE